ncbi:Luciferin sulfotransferase [Frankliniella fusca]|uniref:Luciferin sulfotransferase n=1 Tax=Frankliniella fusca TaxID=407009 RepID=A0AAE1LQ81_9NEOP|nr:Luciferin sulfotransferase [Frankliniella fusca]
MGLTYEPLDSAVAERLDSLFGAKDCLIEVNPGRVIMPPRYQDIGDRIRGLRVREDDVWVVSYPRTGSTWTQEMVWCIGNDLDFDRAKKLIQQFRTPRIELTALLDANEDDFAKELGDTVEMVENMASPRYIKSHLPWDLLPEEMAVVKPRVVYVARDPKDMCVSYYHHCRLIYNMKGSFEEFAELFLQDKAPVGPMWSHILGFWEKRHEPNILFLKYEDLKKDLPATIRRTARFLGKQLSEDGVLKLADYLSFHNMKNNPAVNLELVMAKRRSRDVAAEKPEDLAFIRKGEVGDWKNYMTDQLVAKFDAWTETNLAGTGLTFQE